MPIKVSPSEWWDKNPIFYEFRGFQTENFQTVTDGNTNTNRSGQHAPLTPHATTEKSEDKEN